MSGPAEEMPFPRAGRRTDEEGRDRLVIFDGDDTLWNTQVLYENAKAEIAALLRSRGLDDTKWRDLLAERDAARFEVYGYSPERFPGSCVAAYLALIEGSGMSPEDAVAREAERIAWRVFQSPAAPRAHARAVIEELLPDHWVVLLTQGDCEVQSRRIRGSGLADMFDAIRIPPRKDTGVFLSLLQEFRVSPARAWSIGNSLGSDILPALDCNMNAIHIPALAWEHGTVSRDGQGYVEAKSLDEAAELLREMSRANQH